VTYPDADARQHLFDVGPVEFSDAVVAESRPVTDRMGKNLVPDESQGEFETQTVAFVALIDDMHEECPSKNTFP